MICQHYGLSRVYFLPYFEFELFCVRPQLVIVSALHAQDKQGRLTKKLVTLLLWLARYLIAWVISSCLSFLSRVKSICQNLPYLQKGVFVRMLPEKLVLQMTVDLQTIVLLGREDLHGFLFQDAGIAHRTLNSSYFHWL